MTVIRIIHFPLHCIQTIVNVVCLHYSGDNLCQVIIIASNLVERVKCVYVAVMSVSHSTAVVARQQLLLFV